MSIRDLGLEDNLDNLCIPMGTAVSAKFRGAFCEAIVNSIDKIILCRIQLVDNKKTIKVNAEDIIGNVSANSKVQVKIHHDISDGVILKIIDNSIYHVVFNDGDTGKLRRNQLVLKGDRHYKESESLDKHPLTNPEHFTKAVIYDKRQKDKSDLVNSAEDDEFDNDDQKSCSQESLTTVSSNKTRRQQTHTSSPSGGTAGSSLTTKTCDEVNKTPINKVTKFKKHANTKYLIGCLVMVNRIVRKLAPPPNDKLSKKIKSFVGLIVSPSSCVDEDCVDLKSTQCVVKSFLDNAWYVSYKKDLELVVKRDMLIKHKEADPQGNIYVDKCLLFLDAKILPDLWDSDKLLYSADFDNTERSAAKASAKSRMHSSLTNSLSSLVSSSSDERNPNDKSDSSDQEYQNAKDEWVARFYGFWEDKGNPINHCLEIQGTEVDIYQLYELVKDFGGFQKVNTSVRWPHIYCLLKLPHNDSDNYQRLQTLYKKFIYPYVDMKKKLGTFEQTRNRKQSEKLTNSSQKARPLLSARERREYVRCQFNRKTVEARSVSSQSVCERPIDHGVSGDEIGTNSLIEDTSQLSQCSSSPKPTFDRATDADSECKSSAVTGTSRLSPGTIVSVAYGDKKVYKAKIIQQHSPENKSMKSQSIDSRTTLKPTRTSVDTLSNADSAASSSANIDFKSDIDSSTFYKVHYIGWNSRHDEIISPERILGVISDAASAAAAAAAAGCTDNQSTCSSSCPQKPTVISDTEQASSSDTVMNVVAIDESAVLVATAGGTAEEELLMIDVEQLPTMPSLIEAPVESSEVNPPLADMEMEPMDTDKSSIVGEEQQPSQEEQLQIDAIKADVKIFRPTNLKRRRSKSVCFFEIDTLSAKGMMPPLPESRIIESLNLYKVGDKMPLPPKRLKNEETTSANHQHNHPMFEEKFKREIKPPLSPLPYEFMIHDDPPDRHCSDSGYSPKTIATAGDKLHQPQKEEQLHHSAALKEESDDAKDYFPSERNRSPSFSNDSLSDASTVPFRNEEDQSLFYMSANDDSEKSPPPVGRSTGGSGGGGGGKTAKKRGRKPLFRPDKKPTSIGGRHRGGDSRADIVEVESTSSQHSGSVHGRRVTRSLRTASDQNTVDDNSVHFEDDSQTSQDDSAFQLPSVLPLDLRPSAMVPLASGTPNSSSNHNLNNSAANNSHKGRRPKSRRKNRNSLSTSSADGGYQDSNGETTGSSSVAAMMMMMTANPNCEASSSVNISHHQSGAVSADSRDTNLNFISTPTGALGTSSSSHRPSGRSFQRLHPSLIPVGLEKLPPEERVKLLESVIRQTHFNFLDVKDKIKYVEKQILEIRAGRANGHGVESDEDKFR